VIMLGWRWLQARRQTRQVAGELANSQATLATIPGAFIVWLPDGREQVSAIHVVVGTYFA